MKLTEEQFVFLKKKLFVRESCPNCGSIAAKNLDPHIFIVCANDIKDKSIVVGAMFYTPLAQVTCTNCFRVDFFNLIALGIDISQSE